MQSKVRIHLIINIKRLELLWFWRWWGAYLSYQFWPCWCRWPLPCPLKHDRIAYAKLFGNPYLSVKPWARNHSNEKLRSIGIGSSIRHWQHKGSLVFEFRENNFVSKSISPYTLSSCAVSFWTTWLNHEALNDSVEDHSVVIAFFSELHKILTCLWAVIVEELEVNITHCSLQDNFVWLVLWTELIYDLEVGFVRSLV